MPRDAQPRLPATTPDHFTCAEALQQGLTPDVLRNPAWHVPMRGVRSRREATTALARIAAVATGLPHGTAISCDSAAVLHGFPMPRPATAEHAVHVRRADGFRVRRPGVIAHARLERRRAQVVDGVLTVGPEDTWLDLAAPGHWGLTALVVAGDHLVNRWTGRAVERLEEAVARRRRSPGIRLARTALGLIRTGSRSPAESHARVLVVQEGLPEPALNAAVAGQWGEVVAEVDMLWEEERVIVEYDGETHYEDPEARQATLRRTEMLRDLGFQVVTLTRRDLWAGQHHLWLADLRRRLRTARG
ncbi:DUF559 domain-containing protein [Kytococcus schroeteri]|uniref:DUF559 domain-containing protein n=1 Tax=Kytococcus schroeteri TaxID=138300 RepID=UPI00114494C5|nr:DUF559 domain-containing protein [Kytococcus schroeteri]